MNRITRSPASADNSPGTPKCPATDSGESSRTFEKTPGPAGQSASTPGQTVPHGDRSVVVSGHVLRRPGFSVLIRPRTLIVAAILLVLALVFAFIGLNQGKVTIPLADVWPAAFGQGEKKYVLAMGLRLPRIAAALTAGAALGISGAVFQSVTGNALGSPDVIGLTTGAATGAITQIVLFDAGPVQVMLAALVGGLGAAVVIYLLSLKGGVTGGYRLVLIGLGMGALLGSYNSLLMVRGEVEEAVAANIWVAGSLEGRQWPQVLPVLIGTLVVVPVTIWLARRATLLEMGDDIASQLGVRAEPTRRWLIFCGVALAGLATAAVGPIAFIALSAPQIAKRLTGAKGLSIVPAGLMGSCLLLGADVGSHAIPTVTSLPIGQVTGLIGGIYLAWLLTRSKQI